MNNDTRAKFAAILAAQQAQVDQIDGKNKANIGQKKEAAKSPENAVKNDQPKPAPPKAAALPVPVVAPQPVMQVAVDGSLVEVTASTEPAIKLVDYSEKAFAIIGDTKPIKDKLIGLGGKYNAYLKCGAGWIFSKSRLANVKAALNL